MLVLIIMIGTCKISIILKMWTWGHSRPKETGIFQSHNKSPNLTKIQPSTMMTMGMSMGMKMISMGMPGLLNSQTDSTNNTRQIPIKITGHLKKKRISSTTRPLPHNLSPTIKLSLKKLKISLVVPLPRKRLRCFLLSLSILLTRNKNSLSQGPLFKTFLSETSLRKS